MTLHDEGASSGQLQSGLRQLSTSEYDRLDFGVVTVGCKGQLDRPEVYATSSPGGSGSWPA